MAFTKKNIKSWNWAALPHIFLQYIISRKTAGPSCRPPGKIIRYDNSSSIEQFASQWMSWLMPPKFANPVKTGLHRIYDDVPLGGGKKERRIMKIRWLNTDFAGSTAGWRHADGTTDRMSPIPRNTKKIRAKKRDALTEILKDIRNKKKTAPMYSPAAFT